MFFIISLTETIPQDILILQHTYISDNRGWRDGRKRTIMNNKNENVRSRIDISRLFLFFKDADDIVDVEATDKHENNSKNMRVRRLKIERDLLVYDKIMDLEL